MPVSYKIDQRAGIVFDRAWGVLTDSEILQHTAGLGLDPRFQPDFQQIADFSGVTQLDLSGRTVRGQARSTVFSPKARRAFVVTTEVALGLARMYQLSLGENADELAIVGSLAEAFAWLGLDPASCWPVGPPDAEFHA